MCPAVCQSISHDSTQQLMSLSQNSQRRNQITEPKLFTTPLVTIHFTAKQLIRQYVDLECNSHIMHFQRLQKGLQHLFVQLCVFVCANE